MRPSARQLEIVLQELDQVNELRAKLQRDDVVAHADLSQRSRELIAEAAEARRGARPVAPVHPAV